VLFRRIASMAICPKCGDTLLGAVNRCWKCGQTFTVPPEKPSADLPIDAVVLEAGDQAAAVATAPHVGESPFRTHAPTRWDAAAPRMPTTAEQIEARRAGLMAMGGTVGSLVLGLLAAGFAIVWPPAAIVAVLGLAMGIWG